MAIMSGSRWTRLAFALVAWSLIGLTQAQYDPIKDFCRRFGHQSAIVDRKLYIDGGLIDWKPFSSSSQNFTNPYLTYNDLDKVTSGGMPPLNADLSKNATIPSVHGGILWEDSVNKRLYLYGGEYFQSQPTAFNLYSYDILYDQWISFGPPTGTGTIQAASYGAGVSIPARGEAYYYGGWLSNASVPGWTGVPSATSRMIKYEMDTNTWSNLTGPDDTRRAEGAMVFIPIGDAGMLIYFGGSQDLYGNGTITPQPMDEILIYDVANTKWYTQKTSGRTPELRRRFCAGATWAQDQSSYNIYLYGGAGFDTVGYDDIYILTIPSFQWIRGPYPPGSNVTGAFPKSMMSCNVVDNSQMLVIGGTYSNDSTYACDVDSVWGTHNMNLGEQNKENAIWASYEPSLTTYAVPTDILTAVGGRNTGGATRSAPTSGFDAPDLSVLMTRKAIITSRTPTRNVDLSPPTHSAAAASGPALSTGAIAGIAVGGGVVLILAVAACCCFAVRQRKKRNARRISAPSNVQHYSGGPLDHQQGQHPHGWGGSTQVSSPTFTAASYAHHPPPMSQYHPPAELASDVGSHHPPQVHGDRSASPMSGKYDQPFAAARHQSVHSAELPHSPSRSPGPSPLGGYDASPPPMRADTGWEAYHEMDGHHYRPS